MKIKQLGIFILIILVAFPCFAANRLKYKIADGEVVAMGAMPDLTASAGERVVTVDFEIPKDSLSNFTFDGASLIKKPQPVIDAEEAVQNFKSYDLMGCLVVTLKPESMLKLAPYGFALQSFADHKNWEGIKLFISALLGAGLATEEEAKQVSECFAEQNVPI